MRSCLPVCLTLFHHHPRDYHLTMTSTASTRLRLPRARVNARASEKAFLARSDRVQSPNYMPPLGMMTLPAGLCRTPALHLHAIPGALQRPQLGADSDTPLTSSHYLPCHSQSSV